jgi:hypothetical protein
MFRAIAWYRREGRCGLALEPGKSAEGPYSACSVWFEFLACDTLHYGLFVIQNVIAKLGVAVGLEELPEVRGEVIGLACWFDSVAETVEVTDLVLQGGSCRGLVRWRFALVEGMLILFPEC